MSNFDFSINAKGGDRLSQVVSDSAPVSVPGRTRYHGKFWTADEVEILKAMYLRSSMKDIESALGRKKCSIVNKALSMNLHRSTGLAPVPWNDKDIEILRTDYPNLPLSEISKKLGRTENAISIKAERMGLRRYRAPSPDSMRRLRQIDPVIILLRDERRRQRLSQKFVARKAGFHRNTVGIWELGIQEPRISDLHAWAMALGRDITLADNVIKLPPRDVLLKRWMGRR